MTTTDIKTNGVPSFWKKWWNALKDFFTREAGCACFLERNTIPTGNEPNTKEDKPAA